MTIIPTGNSKEIKNLDELHVFNPTSVTESEQSSFEDITLVKYDSPDNEYFIDHCLKRIKQQYGEKLENIVRVLLDYN